MQVNEASIFPALKNSLLDQRIILLIGMRRVGKTTTLRWLLDQAPSPNKIYLDLERLTNHRTITADSGEMDRITHAMHIYSR